MEMPHRIGEAASALAPDVTAALASLAKDAMRITLTARPRGKKLRLVTVICKAHDMPVPPRLRDAEQ